MFILLCKQFQPTFPKAFFFIPLWWRIRMIIDSVASNEYKCVTSKRGVYCSLTQKVLCHRISSCLLNWRLLQKIWRAYKWEINNLNLDHQARDIKSATWEVTQILVHFSFTCFKCLDWFLFSLIWNSSMDEYDDTSHN